ncbi:MAG TPA: hypothetical protein PLD73_09810 [Candidatus Hydrogenedentes bacterium]|jgi:hypothetical protein|nr:hypothetical protein [Candidatus Hydrogenedentota bacterium]HPJ99609.1 hypothetical protein [Candidatus Hydrogenedentota bacterium]
MPPANDFPDDYGWDDESMQRRERRRKTKDKRRYERIDRDPETEKPRKSSERHSRNNREWADDTLDED